MIHLRIFAFLIAIALPQVGAALPYLPGSGWQEIEFKPAPFSGPEPPGLLFNLEGPFTFSVTAEMEAQLILMDTTPGGVERFEAFNYDAYMGLWTEQGCCMDLDPGSYSLTFRIQAWDTTAPDIEPDIWTAKFQVAIVPEPSTALLLGLGLMALAAGRRRR